MHVVELELQLLIAKNNQERTHPQTPKLQNRPGRFFRSILNGNSNPSSSTNTLISSPTSKFSRENKRKKQNDSQTTKNKYQIVLYKHKFHSRFSSFNICMS